MKRSIIGFFALLVLFGWVAQTNAAVLVNGGFETGNISGWTNTVPSGATTTVTTLFVAPNGPNPSYTYAPTEGTYFCLMKTDGPGSINKLEQSFSASAGYQISFDVFFDAEDWINDAARAYVLDSSSNKVGGGDLFYADVNMVGSYGYTPWTPVSYTFTAADSYTVVFEIWNGGDSILDSYMGVDNVTVIPEPSAFIVWGLLGGLGIAVGWWTRRRKAA